MARENGIQNRIIRHLENRGAYVINIQGGGAGRTGIPDIHATYRGHSLWLEVKAPDGRLSPKQAYELRRILAAGGIAAVVRSVNDVTTLLDELDAADASDFHGATWAVARSTLNEIDATDQDPTDA